MERSGQPEKRSTLNLCFDRVGIDVHAAINRTDDPLDFDRAIGCHFDLGDPATCSFRMRIVPKSRGHAVREVVIPTLLFLQQATEQRALADYGRAALCDKRRDPASPRAPTRPRSFRP